MATPLFDPNQLKAHHQQGFDTAARGWRRWWETWERAGQVLSNHLLALAQIEVGQRILDVATGLGEPAITAARRVGPSGHVVAIDYSAPMLALAQERAAALDLQNLTFYEMDAEQLDRLEERFDAVLCRSGLMFLPHLIPTLEKIRQCLLPGGRFAASIWSTPSNIPVMTFPQTIIRQYVAVPPPAQDRSGTLRLENGRVLEQTLAQAGFREVQSDRVTLVFAFATASDYTRYIQDVSPPVKAMLTEQTVEKQAQIWQAVGAAVQQQFGTPDGSVRLPAEAICVVGVNETQ